MLTEQETAEVRHAAATAHLRRKFTRPTMAVRFVDGPLAGVTSIVEQQCETGFLGWVAKASGRIVQVLYRPGNQPGEWVFDHFNEGVK